MENVKLCEALISSERYGEAIEIINLTLKLAHNKFSNQKKEELQVLAARKLSLKFDLFPYYLNFRNFHVYV